MTACFDLVNSSLTSYMSLSDKLLEEFLGPGRQASLLLPLGKDEVVVCTHGHPRVIILD